MGDMVVIFKKYIISKHILWKKFISTSCEIASGWILQNTFDNMLTLVQVMVWCYETTNHYLNQCVPRSITQHGFNSPQWVNSLCPSDSIWRHRTGSALDQVMACCLMAPSHHLNQCWLFISKVQCHSSEGNSMRDTPAIKLKKIMWKLFIKNFIQISQGPMSLNLALTWARFLSLARSKLRQCSANHRPGYWSEVTCPVIGWAQPELTLSKREKTGPDTGCWIPQEVPNYEFCHLLISLECLLGWLIYCPDPVGWANRLTVRNSYITPVQCS